MNKYLLVSNGYPSKEKLYNNAFIHTRVKQYMNYNLDIDIFIVGKKSRIYEHDGLQIQEGSTDELKEKLEDKKYDKILVHFAFKNLMNTILKATKDTPLMIWVHGAEALGWYRRLFAFNIKRFYRFFGYILINMIQMRFMNKLINSNRDITFVFVSEWMKDILEKDSRTKGKIKKYVIIPNVVDDKIFDYSEKKESDRLKILSIRPYASKKYANDLSVKAVKELSSYPFFRELTFTFYGDGRLFNSVTKPLKVYDNVILKKTMLTQHEISQLHKESGIMIIPTRQDAQGVSMCEAMSSGLVPITSNNTAIPEYTNNEVAYLTNNVKGMVKAVEDLYNNPEKFLNMSNKASKYIQSKCEPKVVIEREIEIIKS